MTEKNLILRGAEKLSDFKAGKNDIFIEDMFVQTNLAGELSSLFFILSNGEKINAAKTRKECLRMHNRIGMDFAPCLDNMMRQGITDMVKIHLNRTMNVSGADFLRHFGFKEKTEKIEILRDEGEILVVKILNGKVLKDGILDGKIVRVPKSLVS